MTGYLGSPKDYTGEDVEAEADRIRAMLNKSFEDAIMAGFEVVSPFGWPITIPEEINAPLIKAAKDYVDYVTSTYKDGVLIKGQPNET